MEISLDNMQVSFMTAGIKTASDSVSLTAAETEIKSRSEAMDKFQEEYRQLKAFVKDYRDTLNNDLAKIDLIINAINENDRKQGDYIKKWYWTIRYSCDTIKLGDENGRVSDKLYGSQRSVLGI